MYGKYVMDANSIKNVLVDKDPLLPGCVPELCGQHGGAV